MTISLELELEPIRFKKRREAVGKRAIIKASVLGGALLTAYSVVLSLLTGGTIESGLISAPYGRGLVEMVLSNNVIQILTVVVPLLLIGLATGLVSRKAGFGAISGAAMWGIAILIPVCYMVAVGDVTGAVRLLTEVAMSHIAERFASVIVTVLFGAVGGAIRG